MLVRSLLAAAVVAVLVVGDPSGAEPLQSSEPESDGERQAVHEAESNGLSIYRYDRAARIATEALTGRPGFKSDKRVVGWITEAKSGVIRVTFYGHRIDGDGESLALYRADVANDGTLQGIALAILPPVPLTEFESAEVEAQKFVRSLRLQTCPTTYNVVMFPTDTGREKHWIAYLIPGWRNVHVVPFGGMVRVELDWNAKSLVTERAFSRTCIELQNTPAAVALGITHLMDPVPTEAHVFWNLVLGKPLLVATIPKGTVWSVTDGMITLQKRGVPQTSSP